MRSITTLFFLTAAFLAPFVSAQEPPSMSLGEKQEPKGGMLGSFGGLGKDRPKDARTEITASKEATFDNAASVAEFTGNVVVHDPQFTLTCDNLKVTLSKNRKGMEVAEATGKVVIVQEPAEGKSQGAKAIGRAGAATYIPATGEVTLRIWPSIQQGINNQVATEEGTVMVLNRNGKSKTIGPSKTQISDTSSSGSGQ